MKKQLFSKNLLFLISFLFLQNILFANLTTTSRKRTCNQITHSQRNKRKQAEQKNQIQLLQQKVFSMLQKNYLTPEELISISKIHSYWFSKANIGQMQVNWATQNQYPCFTIDSYNTYLIVIPNNQGSYTAAIVTPQKLRAADQDEFVLVQIYEHVVGKKALPTQLQNLFCFYTQIANDELPCDEIIINSLLENFSEKTNAEQKLIRLIFRKNYELTGITQFTDQPPQNLPKPKAIKPKTNINN